LKRFSTQIIKEDAYKAFVGSVTQRLQAYYGEPGRLGTRQATPGQQDTIGVLLVFYSVEQGNNIYTTVSVHYRADCRKPRRRLHRQLPD